MKLAPPSLARPFAGVRPTRSQTPIIFTNSNNTLISGQDHLLLIKFSHNSLESFHSAEESSFL